jgi:hypothetical protein
MKVQHTWDHIWSPNMLGWLEHATRETKIEIRRNHTSRFHILHILWLWNKAAIPEIKKSGYKMAFILATKEILSIHYIPLGVWLSQYLDNRAKWWATESTLALGLLVKLFVKIASMYNK